MYRIDARITETNESTNTAEVLGDFHGVTFDDRAEADRVCAELMADREDFGLERVTYAVVEVA